MPTTSNVGNNTASTPDAMPASVQPSDSIYRPIAAYWHTVLLLVLQAVFVYRSQTRLLHAQAMTHTQRIAFYEHTIMFEWLTLALAVAGVWLHKSPLSAVLGPRWSSPRRVFVDFGIGLAFLVVTIVAMSLMGHGDDHAAVNFLPNGKAEFAFWIALSMSAGICEEATFRGYLQHQFIARTGNVAAGIVFSAVVFGAFHFYQGPMRAVQIAVLGALSGILTHWRRSVRPGMIAHALQDFLGGLVSHQ